MNREIKFNEVAKLASGLQAATLRFAQAFAANFAPLAKDFKRACEQFRRAARANYRRAGSPYGDSDEGMMRWLTDGAALLHSIQDARADSQHERLTEEMRKVKPLRRV